LNLTKIENFLIKELVDYYEIADPKKGYEIINSILAKVLNKYLDNLISKDNFSKSLDEIDEFIIKNKKIKIFPQVYFYPESVHGHDFNKAYSVHFSNTSWIPWWKKVLHKFPFYRNIKNMFKKILPERLKVKFFKIKY
jgi:hypothetical protein